MRKNNRTVGAPHRCAAELRPGHAALDGEALSVGGDAGRGRERLGRRVRRPGADVAGGALPDGRGRGVLPWRADGRHRCLGDSGTRGARARGARRAGAD